MLSRSRFFALVAAYFFGMMVIITCSSYTCWLADILEDALHSALPAPASRQKPHVYVALGYRFNDDASPSSLLTQRLHIANELASKDGASLVLSGGVPARFPNTSEAALMYVYSRRCMPGTPPTILEQRSRTTRENAVFTLRLISRNWRRRRHPLRLAVVSNRVHLPRACRTFANAANSMSGRPRIEVSCASAPSSSRYDKGPFKPVDAVDAQWCAAHSGQADPREVIWLALREVAAILLYWARGWL